MNCLHYRAARWLQQGIFDNLPSFGEFATRVKDPVSPRRKIAAISLRFSSRGFSLRSQSRNESATGWWAIFRWNFASVTNCPIMEQASTVSMKDAHDGTHVAYQVKYRQQSHLTFAEVAPFLGITEAFSDRVIFTNASSRCPTRCPCSHSLERVACGFDSHTLPPKGL